MEKRGLPEMSEKKIAETQKMSIKQAARRLRMPEVLITKYASEIVIAQPQLADWYNRNTEQISPELLILVENRAAETSPDFRKRFFSPSRLSEELNINYRIIQRFANAFRRAHPEWFVELPHARGVKGEYYRPELVTKIRRKFYNYHQKSIYYG